MSDAHSEKMAEMTELRRQIEDLESQIEGFRDVIEGMEEQVDGKMAELRKLTSTGCDCFALRVECSHQS